MSCASPPAGRPWSVKLTSFLAIGSLYMTSAAGFAVSLLTLTDPEPFAVDSDIALKSLGLGAAVDLTLTSYLESHGINVALSTQFFTVVYQLIFTLVLCGSVLLFGVTFFHGSSRPLVGLAQLTVIALTGALRWIFQANLADIWLYRYNRQLTLVFGCNLAGFVAYVLIGGASSRTGSSSSAATRKISPD